MKKSMKFFGFIASFYILISAIQAQTNNTSNDTCSMLVVALGRVVDGVPVAVSYGNSDKLIDTTDLKSVNCIIAFLLTTKGNIIAVDSIFGDIAFGVHHDLIEKKLSSLYLTDDCLKMLRNAKFLENVSKIYIDPTRIVLSDKTVINFKKCSKTFKIM